MRYIFQRVPDLPGSKLYSWVHLIVILGLQNLMSIKSHFAATDLLSSVYAVLSNFTTLFRIIFLKSTPYMPGAANLICQERQTFLRKILDTTAENCVGAALPTPSIKISGVWSGQRPRSPKRRTRLTSCPSFWSC